jgi:hypothetical protein
MKYCIGLFYLKVNIQAGNLYLLHFSLPHHFVSERVICKYKRGAVLSKCSAKLLNIEYISSIYCVMVSLTGEIFVIHCKFMYMCLLSAVCGKLTSLIRIFSLFFFFLVFSDLQHFYF